MNSNYSYNIYSNSIVLKLYYSVGRLECYMSNTLLIIYYDLWITIIIVIVSFIFFIFLHNRERCLTLFFFLNKHSFIHSFIYLIFIVIVSCSSFYSVLLYLFY